MSIERLHPAHAAAYRALMLEAYALHPPAFTASVAERAPLPLSWWESRLCDDRDAHELVFGAFEDGRLSGVAGLSLGLREKEQHKAKLFGMYVPATQRQRGLGRRLVFAVLEHAKRRTAIRVVQLTVTEGNSAAEALYKRCGFVAFGLEPFAIANGASFLSKVHMWFDVERSRREDPA